jgi:integrase
MKIQWRRTHYRTVAGYLKNHIVPAFGDKQVGQITKADILDFRSQLAKIINRSGNPLTPSTINYIITPVRMILNEAANRFNFSSPYKGIKSLKIPRTDAQSFTIEEVKSIVDNVRADFKNYYITRFFTGMRSCEIDGLRWRYVDFERKQILVRESYVMGEFTYTKNDGSYRTIDMPSVVYEALKDQHKATGENEFVFTSEKLKPYLSNYVSKRVWYPLLQSLNIGRRNPYQSRHTASTLWISAGESPEWIARQMGHTSTEMPFRVYSRFVPNLTRQDGSAFERLLEREMNGGKDE